MTILSHKSPIFRYLFIPRVSSNLINLSVYLRLCSSLWHFQMVTRSRVWKDFNKIKLMLLTQVTALTVTNCDDLKSLLHDKKHRSKIRDYCVCSIGYLTHLPILPWGGGGSEQSTINIHIKYPTQSWWMLNGEAAARPHNSWSFRLTQCNQMVQTFFMTVNNWPLYIYQQIHNGKCPNKMVKLSTGRSSKTLKPDMQRNERTPLNV